MSKRIVEDIPEPEIIATRFCIGGRYCRHCKTMVESWINDALPNARLSKRTMLVVMHFKIGMKISEEKVSATMRDLFGHHIRG